MFIFTLINPEKMITKLDSIQSCINKAKTGELSEEVALRSIAAIAAGQSHSAEEVREMLREIELNHAMVYKYQEELSKP